MKTYRIQKLSDTQLRVYLIENDSVTPLDVIDLKSNILEWDYTFNASPEYKEDFIYKKENGFFNPRAKEVVVE